MKLDKVYVFFGLIYALLGLGLGIVMSATHNHGQMVTHAHLLLVGFVLSFVYAVMHRLWLIKPAGVVAIAQFIGHQAGTVLMVACLYLLFAGVVPAESLQPVLASASVLILLSLVTMTAMMLPAVLTSHRAGNDMQRSPGV